jgi:hypothetical protein
MGKVARMQMLRISFITLLIAAAAGLTPAVLTAQRTAYGVTVEVADASALSKAATYAYQPGQPAFDKKVDQQIISAIERELKTRGVTKVVSGPSDVTVTYFSVRRTDVDLKSKPGADGNLRQYPVGTLAVSILDSAGREKLFSARVVEPLDSDPVKVEAIVNNAIAAIFEKYPRKGKTP